MHACDQFILLDVHVQERKTNMKTHRYRKRGSLVSVVLCPILPLMDFICPRRHSPPPSLPALHAFIQAVARGRTHVISCFSAESTHAASLARRWLDHPPRLTGKHLPLMHVSDMVLELVLPREAIVARVLAPCDIAWELFVVLAVGRCVVAKEIRPALGLEAAVAFEAMKVALCTVSQ